jgi:thiol:disulfide interchange protein DsbD
VYPLYPITAHVLQARGSQNNPWLHPLVYYFGLVIMYAIFGVIAGVTGGAFNQLLRLPVTNLVIAALILTLGIAGLGWIHLPLFGNLRTDRGPSGLTGTWILGMAAGLLSSPCVGPVVVTLLLQITSGAQGMDAGIVLNSAMRMFVFGLGVGMPFLLIGVFGLQLPKSGRWMRLVQHVLGVVILYFAFAYYLKGMNSLQFGMAVVWGLPAGALTLAGLVFYVLKGSVHHRASRALASGIAVCAVVIAAFAWSGTGRLEAQAVFEKHGNLQWHREPEAAFADARAKNKSLFVDFYADWCTNCVEFSKLAHEPGPLNTALSEAVLLKVTDTDPAFLEYESDPRYAELRIGLPFFLVLSPSGELLFKTNDYLAHDRMIEAIRRRH